VLLASLGLSLLSVHVQLLLQYNSIFYTFEIIIFDIFLESVYDVFELRIQNVLYPFLFSYSVCLNSLRCFVHKQSLFVESAVERPDDVSFCESQYVLCISAFFEADVHSSFHDEKHLLHLLDGHVDYSPFVFGPWLQTGDHAHHELSVDLVLPVVVRILNFDLLHSICVREIPGELEIRASF